MVWTDNYAVLRALQVPEYEWMQRMTLQRALPLIAAVVEKMPPAEDALGPREQLIEPNQRSHGMKSEPIMEHLSRSSSVENVSEAKGAAQMQGEFSAVLNQINLIVCRILECRVTFSKTHVFIYRMACIRRVFEELKNIHWDLDRLIKLTGLEDPNPTWQTGLNEARAHEEGEMMKFARQQTLPFVRNIKGHEAMEALTLMKFEIDYYRPPHNTPEHVAAMKIVFFSIVRSSNGRVSKIPAWYTPPYLMVYDRKQPISGSNVVTTTFRGRYADRKVPGSPMMDVIVKRMELDADGIDSFRKEAEQWFDMDCPHVVKLLAASHCSAPALLLLEDVKGTTLNQYLAQPEHRHELWSKYREAAEGLKYLRFEQRIVHGNVKPNNLLVDRNGIVKVTDFGRGIATLQNLAIQTVVIKTGIPMRKDDELMKWRAPEYQTHQNRPTYQSDVFALGLCIVEAICATAVRNANGLPSRPDGISDKAWNLLMQMCAFEPAARMDLKDVIKELTLLEQDPMKHFDRNVSTAPISTPSELSVSEWREHTEPWFIPSDSVRATERIDTGNFGSVYRARWMNSDVVVKCIDIKTEEAHRAFLQQVGVWYQVRHNHIVPFLGACDVGTPKLAIWEYATRGSLIQYLHQQPAPANRELIWKKLHEAALGLQYLHSREIIHGDLKGDNIVVGGDGRAMVADFGLSFVDTGVVARGEEVGANHWRAPEYLSGSESSPSFASDVYSLGMCIMEAISGGPPWNTASDLIGKHLEWWREPLVKPASMSDAEWKVVSAMCKKTPLDRMSTDKVVEALKQFAEGKQGHEQKIENNGGIDTQPRTAQTHQPKSFVCPDCKVDVRPIDNFCGHCGCNMKLKPAIVKQ